MPRVSSQKAQGSPLWLFILVSVGIDFIFSAAASFFLTAWLLAIPFIGWVLGGISGTLIFFALFFVLLAPMLLLAVAMWALTNRS